MADWFSDARDRRRRHYASRPPRKRPATRAAVTIVHDEPVFLPIWLRYYARFFGPRDIYVLDHQSSPGTIPAEGFVRIPISHPEVDHVWMLDTVQELQHELLDRYDMVLVSDVDEIIAPDPAFGTLGDYLDRFDEDWVNCLGYEVLHLPEKEPPLDPSRGILEQRGHWFINGSYDKAALATTPMSWRPGFHGRTDFQYNLEPDLRLIHLHRMDFDLCRRRHMTRSRLHWAERDERKGWAAHNRITAEHEFRRWFLEDSCFESVAIKLEEIPPAWRGVV